MGIVDIIIQLQIVVHGHVIASVSEAIPSMTRCVIEKLIKGKILNSQLLITDEIASAVSPLVPSLRLGLRLGTSLAMTNGSVSFDL